MGEDHRFWIDLLNVQATWVHDDDMLRLMPAAARTFEGGEAWPRARALTYVANNVATLEAQARALEAGEGVDVDALAPVLSSIRPRLALPREPGQLPRFEPAPEAAGHNPATAHLRFVVQRAFWHFARYAEARLRDPAYPAATPGGFRLYVMERGEGPARFVGTADGRPPEL